MGNGPSRLKFREAIEALGATDVSPEDHDFWDELWKIRTAAEEVFELIGPDDVRQLKSERPGNLVTLFTQAVAQLCQIVHTPVPQYFDQALNCVRVLTRLLPFMLEVTDDPMVTHLCWSTDEEGSGGAGDAAAPTTPAAGTASASAATSDDAPAKAVEGAAAGAATEEREPLACLIVHAALHLLFLPSFTVDISAFEDDDEDDEEESGAGAGAAGGGLARLIKHPGAMWAPGLGVNEDVMVLSTTFDSNRIEVLRLLLAALCDPLYQSAERFDPIKSQWLRVATALDVPNAALLFYSLLNVTLGFDPVGFGLPYGNTFVSNAPAALMEHAAQVLIVLLDYGPPADVATNPPPPPPPAAAAPDAGVAAEGEAPPPPPDDDEAAAAVAAGPATAESPPTPAVENVFRNLLAAVDSPEELDFIFVGLSRLLNNVHEAQNTYMPGALMQVECYAELLVLLWKLMEENAAFLPHILKHCDITKLLVPIVFLMYESRRDPAKVGLVHICTFILLKLSGERAYCVALNKSFDARLPTDLPLFSGNHADLVVIMLHKMVVNGGDKLSPLYNCFLTIICNISPYCKTLSLVASVKLVNLFELFTSPRFLYAAESNHVYVSLLLEIFNNIVQYQYGGNAHLVYAIVRRKKVFVQLENLTLPAAIKAARDSARITPAATMAPASSVIETKPGPEDPPPADEAEAAASDGSPPTAAGDSHAVAGVAESKSSGESSPGADDEAPTAPSASEAEAETAAEAAAASTAAAAESEAAATSQSQGLPQFVPSEDWLRQVKSELPLNTIMRLLHHLAAQVEELCSSAGGEVTVDELAILEFIKNTTMVGLLPVPHPIVIRKYQPNHYTGLWFTAFMWGVIFLQNQLLPLYDGASIKLFTVTVAEP